MEIINKFIRTIIIKLLPLLRVLRIQSLVIDELTIIRRESSKTAANNF